jgi:hypothetical protein
VACWSGGATQEQKGCLHLQASKELQGGATNHLAVTYERGRILQGLAGTRFKGLHYKLEDKLGLYQVPCVFTCCKFCFEISKYIHLSLTCFPHGGFSQGHVDQKLMCKFHACLELLEQYLEL